MTDTLTPVLTAHWDQPDIFTLDGYRRAGGWQALPKALGMPREEVIAMVRNSGLRGRGGAGFPTGVKWGFLPKGDDKPHYLVVNADESEPGACKDVPLMMATPHTLIEGAAIASYAIGAGHAFIYVRGEVLHVIRRLRHAVQEAYAAGYLGRDILGSGFDLDVIVHAGAGAYICGEETALLDSLEGKRGLPRNKPPFPAVAGVYALPTNVNNVESIASVPSIVLNGADWFAGMGTEKSKGFGIFNLSGHVTTPGTFEAPLGITLRELLELSGGMRGGHRLKFWTAGGSSAGILTDQHLDMPLDFESVAAAGSALGTRSVMIFDETTCVVGAVLRWTEFYQHESCGKCTPCREGTFWLVRILDRLEHGQGTEDDVEKLLDVCDNITGRAFCALGDSATPPITSAVQLLQGRVHAAPEGGRLPLRSGGFHGLGCTMTVQTTQDTVTVTIDGFEIEVPKGTLDHPGRRAARHRDPAVLRPPAARPDRRLPPVPGRGRGPAQADGLVHHRVHRGHGGPDPAHLRRRGQGAARRDGVPAHQPPARLPDVRQGRRVPAAEPGHVQRPGRDPVHRRKADLRQAGRHLHRGAAGPRAVHLVHPVHPDVRGNRGRPVHRVHRARPGPDDRHRRGQAVQLLLLRQHRAGLPGRRADRHGLPVPVPAVRPGVGAERVRALRRRAAGSAPTSGAAGCMRRLAGEEPAVNEEWNCDKGRWAFTYATQPDRLTTPLVRDAGGVLVPASWPHALAVAAAGLTAARDADHERPRGAGVLAGGRLTLEDAYAYAKFARVALDTNDVDMRARPHSAEEEQFLAACVAGRDIAVSYADLEQAPAVLLAGFEPEDESPIVFLRLVKRCGATICACSPSRRCPAPGWPSCPASCWSPRRRRGRRAHHARRRAVGPAPQRGVRRRSSEDWQCGAGDGRARRGDPGRRAARPGARRVRGRGQARVRLGRPARLGAAPGG